MYKTLLGKDAVKRALNRIAHEILERNGGPRGLVFVGVQTRGVPLAHRIAKLIIQMESTVAPVGSLDIGLYRDDLFQTSRAKKSTDIPIPIEGLRVILVDDVLYTGRTTRAALDALVDFGRPRKIQLAVMVDRGHRELPIRADYVGKNIPTAEDERVPVRFSETDGIDEVLTEQKVLTA